MFLNYVPCVYRMEEDEELFQLYMALRSTCAEDVNCDTADCKTSHICKIRTSTYYDYQKCLYEATTNGRRSTVHKVVPKGRATKLCASPPPDSSASPPPDSGASKTTNIWTQIFLHVTLACTLFWAQHWNQHMDPDIPTCHPGLYFVVGSALISTYGPRYSYTSHWLVLYCGLSTDIKS